MDTTQSRDRLTGCYVTIPTMFRDDADLSVDLDAIAPPRRLPDRRRLRHRQRGAPRGRRGRRLLDDDVRRAGRGLAGGRRRRRTVACRSPSAARPRARSSWSGSSRRPRRVGADYVQVSPPFYHAHTEGDFLDHVLAARRRGGHRVHRLQHVLDEPRACRARSIERLVDVPNVVSLKWSTPDTAMMTFEGVVSRFGSRFSIIDNQMRYVTSHILGARSIEIHQGNYWPEFAVGLWQMLEAGRYARGPARDGPGLHAVHGPVGRDRGLHGRRRLSRQAVHGARRPAVQPQPPADARRAGAVPRQDPPDAASTAACRTSSGPRSRRSPVVVRPGGDSGSRFEMSAQEADGPLEGKVGSFGPIGVA